MQSRKQNPKERSNKPRDPRAENLTTLMEIKALKVTLAAKEKAIAQLTAQLKAANEELAKLKTPIPQPPIFDLQTPDFHLEGINPEKK